MGEEEQTGPSLQAGTSQTGCIGPCFITAAPGTSSANGRSQKPGHRKCRHVGLRWGLLGEHDYCRLRLGKGRRKEKNVGQYSIT